MSSRSQPNRIEWTGHPQTLDDCSRQLTMQFESIDQMLQILFEDVATNAGATETATAATANTGVSQARVLTRVMVRN